MGMSEQEKLCNRPIGVFDSGVGGLTVAREIMRQLPNERIVYFGDTARVPYGSKSKDTVTKYSRQIVRFLQTQDVKAIVAACNTASAYALDELEQETDVPIIGVVKPGAKAAIEATRNGKIGVIATEATVVLKRCALGGTLGDELAGELVGGAEGHPAPHQPVRQVRGVYEAGGRSAAHIFRLEGHGPDHRRADCEAGVNGVEGVKYELLVLLHILVVRQR